MKFKLASKFNAIPDQEKAISKLSEQILHGEKYQTLLGVTGSGKTFAMAGVIEKVQRPTLIISHNKTLAAQLFQELRDFFPGNAVSYFVGQKPVAGKAAIHQFIEEELMDFPEGAKIINETIEIFVTEDGNRVAEVGAYKLVDSAGVILQNGHYFSFFAKRNGKYVCTRDMATSHPVDN